MERQELEHPESSHILILWVSKLVSVPTVKLMLVEVPEVEKACETSVGATGLVVSRVIESLSDDEEFPAESFANM